jgi:hypothetical protein
VLSLTVLIFSQQFSVQVLIYYVDLNLFRMNNGPLRHKTGTGSGATERAYGKGIVSDDVPRIVMLQVVAWLSAGQAIVYFRLPDV